MTKLIYLLSGFMLTAIGIIGAFLPVLPTTVFLIGALFCFAKSSPKLEVWLLTHPRFGASLVAWRRHGAISKRVKCMACCSMLISFILVCLLASLPLLAYAGIAILMGSGAYFIITRPSVVVH